MSAVLGNTGASAAFVRLPAGLRSVLVFGLFISVVAAGSLGQPAENAGIEHSLVLMLRGMAAIKLCAAAAAAGLVFWRMGAAVSAWQAGLYLCGTWLLVGASVLVWRLTCLPAAAIGFHFAEITLLLVAWRDGAVRLPGNGRRALHRADGSQKFFGKIQ